MKTTKLFFAALASLALASCQNENFEFAKLVTANIQGNIGKGLATRASNTTWDKDDAIGVFVKDGNAVYEFLTGTTNNVASNVKFTTTGGDASNNTYIPFEGLEIPFPSNGNTLSFQGYYPYKDPAAGEETVTALGGTETAPTFTVKDWSDQTKSKDFDLMVSEIETKNAEQAKDDNEVKLTFHHMFSKIILTVSVNDAETQIQDSELEGMEVTAAGMNVVATCNAYGDIETPVITPGDPVDENIKFVTKDITTDEEKINVVAEAIVCPDYNTATSNRKVTFTLANRVFNWTIPSGTKFESGKSYIWSIRLNGDGLVTAVLKATIVDWNPQTMNGGNVIDIWEPGKQPQP